MVRVFHIDAAAYHADKSCLSSSALKDFLASPVDYRDQHVLGLPPRREIDKDLALVGSVCHAMTLEPHTVAETYVEIPTFALAGGSYRRGRVWEEWNAAVPPHPTPVLGAQMRLARRMADSVLAQFGDLLASQGYVEIVIQWPDDTTGIDCKARLDKVYALTTGPFVLDLKTTGSLEEFLFVADRLKYWLQAAHYSAAAQAWLRQRPAFAFLAVERNAPHRCQLYQMPAHRLDAAMRTRSEAVRSLQRCLTTNVWPETYHEARVAP
jgi:hypothetical protein